MKKVIKSINVVNIAIKHVDRKETTGSKQGCIKCTGVKSRAKMYIVTDEDGNKNKWHPKCFNLHYGKAVKPEGKARKLLDKFLVVEEKPKKVRKGKKSKKHTSEEETSEGVVEETIEDVIEEEVPKKTKKSTKKVVDEEED